MKQHLFYRNVRARDYLELFLVTAVSTLLIQRFILFLTHYPQVGGSHLHIAHMLYGGLLMMAAIVLMITFLGERIIRIGAFIGGIGFGLFIDELGKFITKDNNYFFRPTVGLIYAIFIIMFLAFNFLSRTGKLTKREYELNALNQFEEAVLKDLDPTEKRNIQKLLTRSDSSSPVVIELKELLKRIDTIEPPLPGPIRRLLTSADKMYEKFWRTRGSRRLIGLLFVAQSILFVGAIVYAIFTSFDSVIGLTSSRDGYANRLLIGEFTSALIAACFAIAGAYKLFHSRLQAFELFRRATLINLLLTEFFIFSRIEFGALPSFILNLLLFLALRYAIYEERQTSGKVLRS